MQVHAHGRLGAAQRFGDLGRGHVVELQRERGPLLRGEPVHGRLQGLLSADHAEHVDGWRRVALDRRPLVIVTGGGGISGRRREDVAPPAVLAAVFQAHVDEHSIEPRGELGAAAELARGTVQADERLLTGVARLLGVTQDVPGQPTRSLLVARDQEIEGGFLPPGHAPTQHLIGWLHSPSLLSLLLILDIPLELPPILAPIAPVAPQVLAVGPEVLPRVLHLVLVAALDRLLQLLAIFANVAPVAPDLPAILPQLLTSCRISW